MSPYAFKSKDTLGRKMPVTPCNVRTDFLRDRDRIVHSKSFRRLKHKTQVFLSPEGDHFRTRLTHTLEVAQISRTIARALMLNEDLVEAIVLGHDLGHTPFGHAGEEALNEALKLYHTNYKDKPIYDANAPTKFKHNEQSLRIVEFVESGIGMNLTHEVRDGILNHSSSGNPSTLEGKLIQWTDRIAYINHDIDDAIRANVLLDNQIPGELDNLFGHTVGERINSMVVDMIEHNYGKNSACPSPKFEKGINQLRKFMFSNVYNNKPEEVKAKHIVRYLFEHYLSNPEAIPEELRNMNSSPVTKVCDYIASMTDWYAIACFKKITIPKSENTTISFDKLIYNR